MAAPAAASSNGRHVDEAGTVAWGRRVMFRVTRAAEAMGARARERVLDEHTYAHRARRVLSLLDLSVPAGAR